MTLSVDGFLESDVIVTPDECFPEGYPTVLEALQKSNLTCENATPLVQRKNSLLIHPWLELLELFTSFCRLPSSFFMIL